MAVENKAASIAFPAISTGAYGFPFKLASKIAISAICKELANKEQLELIIFSCFNDLAEEIYLGNLKTCQKYKRV